MLSRAWSATNFLSLVLFLQQAKRLGIFDFQAAKLLLPLVVSGRTDAVAVAKLFDGGSGLRFLQDGNDLFFAVSGSLHGLDRYAPFGAADQPSSGISGVSSVSIIKCVVVLMQ
jgi:hypothetical protein